MDTPPGFAGSSVRGRPSTVLTALLVVALLGGLFIAVEPAMAAAGAAVDAEVAVPGSAREVRTVHTGDAGVPRPAGVAFDASGGQLLVGATVGSEGRVVGLEGEDHTAATDLGAVEVGSMSVTEGGELVILGAEGGVQVPVGDLEGTRPDVAPSPVGGDVVEPAGVTVDGEGVVLVLDATSGTVVEGDGGGSEPVDLGIDGELRGLAHNPEDDALYTIEASEQLLHAFGADGVLLDSFDLSDTGIQDPSDLVFAPSSDPFDDADAMNLFVADAGSEELLGGVVEVTLSQVTATNVPVVSTTLVRMTETSRWVPASPDPSGVTYLPGPDRLTVVDSEVNEVTGAGYHGVNVWEARRNGTATRGWNTLSFTNEPTGVSHDPATNRLFISTDSGTNGIHIVRAGPDGVFGTSDDSRSFLNTAVLGLTDTEDPEFDTATGHLWFLNGISTRVFRVDPVDGVFGNGNDIVTHFDVGHHGPTDIEGLTIDQHRGTLLLGDRRTARIYEVTRTGALVRIIDAGNTPGRTFLSGLGLAPASDDSGRMNLYMVDRAVDNGADPKENDGRLFELSIPGTQTPPSAACPPGVVPSAGFRDVGGVHREAIDCVAWHGLFRGFSDGTFGPQRSITRGQFASALARLVSQTGTSLPARGRGFPDVAPGSTHAAAIGSLAAAGVIDGFADGTFRPGASITREQAASLMVRAHGVVVGSALPAGPDAFGDDDGSVHERNINAAAAAGWIQGRGPRVFEPRSDISRAQMASVMARMSNTWVVDGVLVLPRL